MNPDQQANVYALRARATSVFTPGAPVSQLSLFRGRNDQIEMVLEAVTQFGQHPVIYGERGVGKTSLVSVLHEIFARAGMVGLRFAHINCDKQDTFASLWRKVFRELTVSENNAVADSPQKSLPLPDTLDQWLGDEVTPDEIRRMALLTKNHLIVVIDEFDQLAADGAVARLMANTIKTLSDRRAPLTIVLVGVADTIDKLIQEHESIDRNLVQVRMPRMSSEEIGQVIDEGLAAIGMGIEEEALRDICSLVQGLPAAAHHIGLQLSYHLIDHQGILATKPDVSSALEAVIRRMGQSLLSDWVEATTSPRRDALFKQVLVACALAPRNDLGWFQPVDVRQPFRAVTQKQAYDIQAYIQHLNLLSSQRGNVLEKTGDARRWQFRFRKPLFHSYVIMRGLTEHIITDDVLRRFRDNLPSQSHYSAP